MSTTFEILEDASKFNEWMQDKFWLFSQTWQAQVAGQVVSVKGYPTLSIEVAESFLASRLDVPRQLCAFLQYYSKQLDTVFSLRKQDAKGNLVSIPIKYKLVS